jgi:hypothetical protein
VSFKTHRQSFFLVEIILAGLLAAILVSGALWLCYDILRTSIYYEKKIEREESLVARVSTIRSILQAIEKGDKDAKTSFYLVDEGGSGHLFFTGDFGARYEVGGSNEKYGQLYVNKDHELIFVYSAMDFDVDQRQREEHAVVLWKNVSRLTFSFVISKDQRQAQPVLQSHEDEGNVLHVWEKDWQDLPAAITTYIHEIDRKEPLEISVIVADSFQQIQVP